MTLARLEETNPRLLFWLRMIGLFVVIETIDHASLAVWLSLEHPSYLWPVVMGLPLGMIEDVSTGIVMGMPFLIGIHLARRHWRKRGMRLLAYFIMLATCGAVITGEIGEVFFWNEFSSRFNSIAVNYLMFPREVIGNIRESFNLAPVLAAAGILTLLTFIAMRGKLDRALSAPSPPGERRRAVAAGSLLLAAAFPAMYWGPFEVSDHREVNEMVANGFHSLIVAAVTNDTRYDGLYPGITEDEAVKLARGLVAQDNTEFIAPEGEASMLRRVTGSGAPRKLNIILVLEESFGSIYVDGLDNHGPESISPNLVKLAKDGVFFTNIHATGNRTVRALEAVLASFPPLPGISTARRPGSENMNSMTFVLRDQGYETAFLYGGRAAFDNMGKFWSNIGFEHVWDQNDIAKQSFTTIWGVADEDLFTEALSRMDAMSTGDKPVFLGMLTVSNHRPYSYPAGRIAQDPKARRRENAAAYADWAFGDFVARAKSRPWFDNTVFVFVGDHGPRVYGAAQVPVPSYRVPMLFYSPANLPPARIETLGSSMDLGPTLFGLLGFTYDSPFFGIDLLRVPDGHGRILMEHNFAAAYGDGKEVAILVPGAPPKGYLMEGGDKELITKSEGPGAVILAKAVAVYQTAHHMFYDRKYHVGSNGGKP